MASLPRVSEYMDTTVASVPPTMPISDAVDFLLAHRVTGAPVVKPNGEVVGILTEKDCLKLLTKGVNLKAPVGLVSEYMSTEVAGVPPEMDVFFAAGIFLASNFRRLLVMQNDRLVGAITRFDILRAVQKARTPVSGSST